ncbi:hypothetical protein V6N13_073743 [Hibiscus sabdariffa]
MGLQEEVEEEHRKIEKIAELLCWEKELEMGDIAVWRKRKNYETCRQQDKPTYADDVWYKKMDMNAGLGSFAAALESLLCLQ